MSIYDYSANNIKGEKVSLKKYTGKVLLIVNTASKCGFTKQYSQLEELYKKYNRQLEILAFPCNQFGSQEPGNSKEIKTFCDLQFNLSFDLFEKIDVNGTHTHSLYKYLKTKAPGLLGINTIKWNFTKFLIDRSGTIITRYSPQTPPKNLVQYIEKLL